ncbi:hypothetical protein [Nocardia veterana]|uniref:Uncharacterized protein n=1 Tax=Nocardia veterana TaxID=132249 RepID=A0A7X6LWD9_9NOCA|nr:hypothetical protein [Nocardia veterana]NKY85712.1 hypothetical protein [Nocardia veterana]
MTELEFDAADISRLADAGLIDPAAFAPVSAGVPSESTPLQRAAARLQAVLPPGWQVDIEAPRSPGDPQPALRVHLSGN